MTKPFDFSLIPITGNAEDFLEIRREFDVSNNEIYRGYARKPNASTASEVWFILKFTYDSSKQTRQQLPDDGPKFAYAWDDRATYFS